MAYIETLLSPWSLFLGALILVVAAIIVLTVIERRLNKRVLLKKEEEETHFQRQIEGVRTQKANPQKFLNAIDELARNFFESKFEMNKGMRYSDFIKEFKKNGNDRAAKFCIKMQETLYAGEKINDTKLDSLLREIEMFIIDEESGERDARKLMGGYWQQEVDLGKIKSVFKEDGREDRKIETPQEIEEDDEGEKEIEKLRKEIKEEDKERIYNLKTMQKERKINLEKKTETIKKESEFDSFELRQTPLQIEDIKINKIKRSRKELKGMDKIESIDNLDRLKEKIRERRQTWAIQGVAID